MSKLIAIMQPTYLPWLGYFHMINQVDEFVFLDNVQLVKRSWGVRNKIKTPQGEIYLTVPIKKTESRDDTFYSNAQIDYNLPWIKKHLNSIKMNYSKSSYFEEVFSILENCLLKKPKYLSDLNTSLIILISNELGVSTPFVLSSKLHGIKGKKDDRLVSICKTLKAGSYLSAESSAIYIEAKTPGGAFAKNNINLQYHKFNHPIYPQLNKGFISHLSIIDLLFSKGFSSSYNFI